MKITNELIVDIVYGEIKDWIKIKAFDARVSDNYLEMYQRLMTHHEEETARLIKLVKALAEHIDDLNQSSMPL